jgi:hypothetical protein
VRSVEKLHFMGTVRRGVTLRCGLKLVIGV